MALCGKRKRAWLQPCLPLPHGMPAHAPLGRVFARLTPQRCQAGCLSWTQAVAPLPQEPLVSLAGHPVKASVEWATASASLPLVSAWCA
jgi:hypothetical protein